MHPANTIPKKVNFQQQTNNTIMSITMLNLRKKVVQEVVGIKNPGSKVFININITD